ncbi:MAG: acyl-CoA thioesterase, partial [Oscillospiraceae bacterium]|nr:acyl-CoA thioesterase [Oscillospiraceae bacterium]
KNSTTFADEVQINVSIKEFRGVRLVLHYQMLKQDGSIAALAESTHCFLNSEGRPIRLAKQFPEFYQALMDHVSPEPAE